MKRDRAGGFGSGGPLGRALVIALVAACLTSLAPVARSAAAQQATATLTILAGSVSVQPSAATGAFAAATDGMDLADGARIRTAAASIALVTFVDGSTVTVQPESEIGIQRAGGASQGPSRTSIQIFIGTVWARVVRLLDPGSEFSLEGQNATATVRGSQIGAQQNADGTFVCWTRAGSMVVTGFGQSLTLQPGQATTVAPGQAPTPRPFAVNASSLRATSDSPVLPMLVTPAPELQAGYAPPGIVVSQVFGSAVGEDVPPRTVDIPAGRPGRYLLVVEGEREADFRIGLTAAQMGQVVAERELRGRVRAGERVVADVTPRLEAIEDPRTARITGVDVSDFRPLVGPPPGRQVLAPAEVAGVRTPQDGTRWQLTPGIWGLLGLLVVGLAVVSRVARRP